MFSRAHPPDTPDTRRYGGRGISVCERWRQSFEDFLSDMGPRPPRNQLDRYPNTDGNYEPSNCRWASKRANCRNKSTEFHRTITHDGRKLLLCEWAAETGISRETISDRLRHGWSIARALTEPPRASFARKGRRRTRLTRIIEFRGRRLNLQEWAKVAGIDAHTITDREKRGWSISEILTTPPQRD